MHIGANVISDLDGKQYTVTNIRSAQEIRPLPDVMQPWTMIEIMDEAGNTQWVYDWEVEYASEDQKD